MQAPEVAGLVVRDDHEIDIELAEALPIYPALLTDGSTAIVRAAGASKRRARD